MLALAFLLSGFPAVFVVVYTLLLAANVVLTGALLWKWFATLRG